MLAGAGLLLVILSFAMKGKPKRALPAQPSTAPIPASTADSTDKSAALADEENALKRQLDDEQQAQQERQRQAEKQRLERERNAW